MKNKIKFKWLLISGFFSILIFSYFFQISAYYEERFSLLSSAEIVYEFVHSPAFNQENTELQKIKILTAEPVVYLSYKGNFQNYTVENRLDFEDDIDGVQTIMAVKVSYGIVDFFNCKRYKRDEIAKQIGKNQKQILIQKFGTK